MDSLSIYEADQPKFVITDLVARDLLDPEQKRAQFSKHFDEEMDPSLIKLPLCTLCDTELIDGKEMPTDKVLTSDLDYGMRLLFDYALVIDPDTKTPKTLKVNPGSTQIHKFFVDENAKRPYTQISDHYGISFDIGLNCT